MNVAGEIASPLRVQRASDSNLEIDPEWTLNGAFTES
jgi:hypothetical protein